MVDGGMVWGAVRCALVPGAGLCCVRTKSTKLKVMGILFRERKREM